MTPTMQVDVSSADSARSGPPAERLVPIFGLPMWDAELGAIADALIKNAAQGIRMLVLFVNAHCINTAARVADYRQILMRAPFLLADGVGISLAARLDGQRLENNVNGTDLFPLLCERAARSGTAIALLGSRPGVAERCAERMQAKYPGLRVAFTHHGFFDPADEPKMMERLNASGAKLLFVAKGVPKQELWAAQHFDGISAPLILCVGALFDFFSGDVLRAPGVVRRMKLEWLFRLAMEPKRMFGRYVVGNPLFVYRAVKYRLTHKL